MRYLLKEPITKICEYSGETFLTKNKNQKYANHNYSVLAWNKNNTEKLKEIRKLSDSNPNRVEKRKNKYKDPDYKKKYNQRYGKEYRDKKMQDPLYRKHKREKERERTKENREFLRSYKLEKGCIDCGYNKHFMALDFDHKDPSKKLFNIGSGGHHTMEDLISEVNKCDIRCANCHRIKTYENKEGIHKNLILD
jgi:hypothetical protein